MKKILLLSLLVLFGCSKEASEPEIPRYSLTVTANPAEGGLVNPTTGSYNAGSQVTILASPNDYYRFSNWTGNWNGSENQVTITMDSNKTLTATNLKAALWETLSEVKNGDMQPMQADSIATQSREILRTVNVQLRV